MNFPTVCALLLIMLFSPSAFAKSRITATQKYKEMQSMAAQNIDVEAWIKFLRKNHFAERKSAWPIKGGCLVFAQGTRLIWSSGRDYTIEDPDYVASFSGKNNDWRTAGNGKSVEVPTNNKCYSVFNGTVSEQPKDGEEKPTFVIYLKGSVIVVSNEGRYFIVLDRNKGPAALR